MPVIYTWVSPNPNSRSNIISFHSLLVAYYWHYNTFLNNKQVYFLRKIRWMNQPMANAAAIGNAIHSNSTNPKVVIRGSRYGNWYQYTSLPLSCQTRQRHSVQDIILRMGWRWKSLLSIRCLSVYDGWNRGSYRLFHHNNNENGSHCQSIYSILFL